MNHWQIDELTRLACAERERELERELDAYRLQMDFSAPQVNLTFTNRVALKLSDWMISGGESLRRRYEKAAPVSPWVNTRKFAR